MVLFLFFLIAVGILFLQSQIFYRYSLRRLEYERKFQKRACYKGEQIELIEEISNRKWLPVPWIRVESQLSSYLQFGQQDNFSVSKGQIYQNHRSFFTLKPYVKIRRTHRIVPVRRGIYRLHTVTITSGDLLGMRLRHQQLALSDELIVYPKLADVSLDELPFHSWQGEHSVRRWIIEDPFVIAGARPYAAGDSYRNINWNATARVGELQVHKYDYTANRQLLVYLNIEDGEEMWRAVNDEELIEQGIEWAAGAIATTIDCGMLAGFGTNMMLENKIPMPVIAPGSGYEHMEHILETMARLVLERTEPFTMFLEHEAHQGFANQDILIISTYWTEQLEHLAMRLRGNGNSVTHWPLIKEAEMS
ncbi:DUF58 domain-containing protein [Paenibacillus yanchengensis]|uniref:DUF58 domain-containing protein n=1 Tax=Paenibacillus yanchengensis TaxID=2035833 RepID=A0ABW4YQW6_9BACL